MMRRAISKKKQAEILRERQAFIFGDEKRAIPGCIANGIIEKTAEAIYDEILDFANYAFNKAHAVSYAVIAYQTAWFKCHHTKEYMAALLTSVLDSSDKVAGYIGECRECGIALLPPDVNESEDSFTIMGDAIRFGLVAAKGIGRGFILALSAERERGGKFSSFQDFCERMYDRDLNKRVMESLIKCGAFDCFGHYRAQLMQVYEPFLDNIGNIRRRNLEGQFDLFGGPSDAHASAAVLPNIPEFSIHEKLSMEKETTGLYLSGHPMDNYRGAVRSAGAASIGAVLDDFGLAGGPSVFKDEQRVTLAGVVSSVKTKTTRNQSLMAYVTLEDDTGSMELLAFQRVLSEYGNYLKDNTPVLITGRLSARDEKEPQLLVDTVRPLSDAASPAAAASAAAAPRKLYLRLPSEDCPAYERIKLILIMFPGTSQIVFYFSDTGRRQGAACVIHDALLRELRELLGDDNVVVK